MTHNELLDTIGHWNWVEPAPLLKALRAVVELHKPFESGVCGCELDSPLSYTYPCLTIQAIEKELK